MCLRVITYKMQRIVVNVPLARLRVCELALAGSAPPFSLPLYEEKMKPPVFNHGVMAFYICYSFIKNPLAANFLLSWWMCSKPGDIKEKVIWVKCDELCFPQLTFHWGRHQWVVQLKCKRGGCIPSDITGTIPNCDFVFETTGPLLLCHCFLCQLETILMRSRVIIG